MSTWTDWLNLLCKDTFQIIVVSDWRAYHGNGLLLSKMRIIRVAR